jgi:hypothetical protein
VLPNPPKLWDEALSRFKENLHKDLEKKVWASILKQLRAILSHIHILI